MGGAEHTVPQSPQFELSLCLSTQAPLQLTSGSVQVSVQTAAEQTSVMSHWKLQAPQLEALDWRLTQAPEHGL